MVLKIEKENAVKAYEQASNKGKTLLSNLFGEKTFQKDVMERIQTVEDVLRDHDFTVSQFNDSCIGLEDHEKSYRFINLLCKSLNEGWEPDWSNVDQGKYVPWFNMDDGSSPFGFSYSDYGIWLTGTIVGSRLCFKDSKLAKYAGTQFLDEYRKLMVIK